MILDVGIFGNLGLARQLSSGSNVLQFPTGPASQIAPLSPWSEGQLQGVVWSTLEGVGSPIIVDRASAMSLPSVAVGRSLIINALAGRPLRAIRGGEILAPAAQPAWLYRTNTAVANWFRMAWTFDDFIFYGHSLWTVERGTGGQITDAMRVPIGRWSLGTDGEILVDDHPVPEGSVLYLAGPFDGLLNSAQRTLAAALELEKSWTKRAATPLPMIVLEEKEDNGMTLEEAQEYVDAVAEARRSPSGAVMFVPYSMNARIEGDILTDLMTEARNAVKLDVANFLNLNASMLDAALPKASLNYETTESKGTDFEGRMPYWTQPLEARLSMDDVCPRGQRIAFDFADSPALPTAAATGPYQED